jgi:hypothetical protein
MQGKKQEEFVESSISIFTGLADLKIVAINPTLDELNALQGSSIEKEPVYTNIEVGKDDNGNPQIRNKVLIYLANNCLVERLDTKTDTISKGTEKVTAKLEFLVSPEFALSSNANSQFINNLGNNTYSKSLETLTANEKMDWFYKEEPIVQGYLGEAELLDFFKAFLYIAWNEPAGFKNREAIMKGDVIELKNYVKAVKTNEVTCLLGAKQGKDDKFYQAVYTKKFTRATMKNPSSVFIKELNGKYGEFKAEYSKDLKLRVFNPTAQIDTPDNENIKSDFSSNL